MPYSSTNGQIAKLKVCVVFVRAPTPLAAFRAFVIVFRGELVLAEVLRRSQYVCGHVCVWCIICSRRSAHACGDQHVHVAISMCALWRSACALWRSA